MENEVVQGPAVGGQVEVRRAAPLLVADGLPQVRRDGVDVLVDLRLLGEQERDE